jgi:hypothetical protein
MIFPTLLAKKIDSRCFQQVLQSIEELNKQIADVRGKLHETDAHASLKETVRQRLDHLQQNLTTLHNKAKQSMAFITVIKVEREQLIVDVKQMNDWLRLTDQQLNKYSVANLSTAEDKKEAAKRITVSETKNEIG